MAYISFQPNDHFNTVAWTGTSSSPLNITGFGFQPDWVWNKYRAGAGDHQVYDSVRTATKMIIPNSSNAESTNANGVTAFISDGFSAGSDINVNGGNSVAWGWKAGTTSGITTNGSTTITPAGYSFNATAGFSIIKCAGTGSAGLFPHGLGVAPKIVITKDLTSANSWIVQTNMFDSWTANNYLTLNGTAVVGTNNGIVNSTDATNVSLAGSDDWVNASGRNYIHYCFAEKKGFSKFGSYTGNGNTNGVFCYTGFSPAFVLTRRISGATGDWQLHDNQRTPINVSDTVLFPNGNTADSQASGYALDMLSNGFKIRTDNGGKNNSGSTYMYLAFAAEPLVASNGTPATAR